MMTGGAIVVGPVEFQISQGGRKDLGWSAGVTSCFSAVAWCCRAAVIRFIRVEVGFDNPRCNVQSKNPNRAFQVGKTDVFRLRSTDQFFDFFRNTRRDLLLEPFFSAVSCRKDSNSLSATFSHSSTQASKESRIFRYCSICLETISESSSLVPIRGLISSLK